MLIGLDTNILVHATVVQDEVKHEKAKRFLERLVGRGNYVVSLQVIGEYFSVILRVAPSMREEARELAEIIAPPEKTVHYTLQILSRALETSPPNKFWDTLLALTYLHSGASVIATENEKDFRGIIRTLNPFKTPQYKPSQP